MHRRVWVDTVVEEVFGAKQEWRSAHRKSGVSYNAYAAYLAVVNVYGEQESIGWGDVRE